MRANVATTIVRTSRNSAPTSVGCGELVVMALTIPLPMWKTEVGEAATPGIYLAKP